MLDEALPTFAWPSKAWTNTQGRHPHKMAPNRNAVLCPAATWLGPVLLADPGGNVGQEQPQYQGLGEFMLHTEGEGSPLDYGIMTWPMETDAWWSNFCFSTQQQLWFVSSQGCRAGPAPQQCRLTGCTLRVWPQPSEVEQFHHPNEGWTGPLLSDNIWTLQSRLLTMINRDCHSTCKAIDDRLSFLKHVFMLENF